MAVEKFKLASIASLLTTELNSLANNANSAASPAYSNVQGGGAGDGYTLCDVELVVTYGSAPTAGTGVSLWFLGAPDGTNYEDGSSSVTPARVPDVVFPVRAVTTAQRINRRVGLPWGLLKALARNEGTGQAFAASGNVLSIRPATREGTA